MKKLIILVACLVLLSGCTSLKDTDLSIILSDGLSSNVKATNIYRKGYSYYLPKGINVDNSTDYNEILKDNKYNYYLYVDVVSFFNKVTDNYEISSNSYISRTIKNNDKIGYLEINKLKNEKYLIEIMYNYAKIEVMVEEKDINRVVAYAISILSSVTYNDSVIANLMGDDVLNFMEEEFNIFETVSSDGNYLKYEEDYNYVEEDIPDTDLIN